MTTPLWAKTDAAIDDRAMRFMVGDDLVLDQRLLPYDIEASRAHVAGLAAIGALSGEDASALDAGLASIGEDIASGALSLDERFEDGHSAIEWWLTERLGDVGRRVHLGRSRNDQALVAIRMYMRGSLEEARRLTLACAQAALDLAAAHEHAPMPGYTHLQRAVPSTVGLWMGSFVEAFLDDAELLQETLAWIDRCPLGTAAGYGVNLALPRSEVGEQLGFERLQLNPMAAQASRGKHEMQTIAALWQVAQTIRRLAWDVTLFASAEFGFVRVSDVMSTGSSIMPNKRNPDVPELLRAVAATVGGALSETMQVVSLPSGYHRDLQRSKGPLVRAFEATLTGAEMVPALLEGLTLDTKAMRAAIDADMHATDMAVERALAGATFRDAYRELAEARGACAERTAEASVAQRVSPGACADLGLEALGDRLHVARS